MAVAVLILLFGIWILINGFNGNLSGVILGDKSFNFIPDLPKGATAPGSQGSGGKQTDVANSIVTGIIPSDNGVNQTPFNAIG